MTLQFQRDYIAYCVHFVKDTNKIGDKNGENLKVAWPKQKKRTGNVIILLTLNGCVSKKFGKIPRKLLVEIRDIKFDTEWMYSKVRVLLKISRALAVEVREIKC